MPLVNGIDSTGLATSDNQTAAAGDASSQTPNAPTADAAGAVGAAAAGGAGAAGATGAAGAGTATVAERPAYIPEAFWDAEKGAVKGEDFAKHFADLTALKTKQDERNGTVPASADAYKLELAPEIKLPEGATINEADPLYVEARKLAHELQLPQGEFNRLANLVVKSQIDEATSKAAALKEFRAGQLKLLGERGRERVEGVEAALKARFNDDAKHLIPLLVSAKQVELIEGLLGAGNSGGFSQTGREDGGDKGLPPNWNQMSALDRRAYQITQNMNPRK